MNRSELVEEVSNRTRVSQDLVDQILKATCESVRDAVTEGDSVTIINFGTFYPWEYVRSGYEHEPDHTHRSIRFRPSENIKAHIQEHWEKP